MQFVAVRRAGAGKGRVSALRLPAQQNRVAEDRAGAAAADLTRQKFAVRL